MANEFVAKNGLISQNNTIVSGSLTVTQGITGSLQGTASWADNAVTASYVSTLRAAGSDAQIQYNNNGILGASSNFRYGISNINIGSTILGSRDIISSDEMGVSGDSDQIIALHNPNTLTYHYSSGKYKYDDINNIHSFTGSLGVTAGITGSLQGTSSWAENAVTASYITASNVVGTITSASYALTASYAMNGGGGGVTSITAGDGISVNQSTGDVTITNTGGTGGGISQGKVVAIATGYSNLF